MFQQNFRARNNGHVNLVQKQQQQQGFRQISSFSKLSYINILNQSLDFLPRQFTITTNNGSYKFNVEIIKDLSKTISDQLEKDPNNLEYHLDTKDDQNIIKKFEDILRGITVSFEFTELLSIRQIIQKLEISNCPDYFKPDLNSGTYLSIPSNIEIDVERISLSTFLKTKYPKNFTIKTNKNEYQCTELGALSSKVIRDLKKENPEMMEYMYNFEDEDDEFKLICMIFNFEDVNITVKNMDSLKIISDELQIDPICESIDKYISSYENSVQLIDDKKLIIDTIDEIFHLLHNIPTLTVDTVKKSILKSVWVKTEENVQELVACIMQAVRIGYNLQPYLIDLVISLDKSVDDQNELKYFLPYLINQFKFNFQVTPFYTSFYYRLVQKGVVDFEEAIKNVMKIVMDKRKPNREIVNSLLWFLPELFDKFKNDNEFYKIQVDEKSANFFKSFFPLNVEIYKKMRDTGEPANEFANAIYKDDVDTLQSIVSKRGIDINVVKIPPSLFDVFIFENPLSFIDYSVLHGSVKCFKYLLLNHAELGNLTFVLSVYGGNTEIIRTVDQQSPPVFSFNNNNNNRNRSNVENFLFDRRNYYSYKYDWNYLVNILSPAIMKHNNELFDWIFENKFDTESNTISLMDVAFIAVQNGNAHAFIYCIDKGLDLDPKTNHNFIEILLNEACHDGFYRILQLIVSLCKDSLKKISIESEQLFFTGNISIYNLIIDNIFIFINSNSSNWLLLMNVIERGYSKLVSRIIENSNFMPINRNSFRAIFNAAFANKDTVIFNILTKKYPFERIMNMQNQWNNDNFDVFDLLCDSCEAGFFEAAKDIIEFILSKNPQADFTRSFFMAVSSKNKDIYDYMLEKNVRISLKPNDPILEAITQMDDDLCIKLLDKIDDEVKEDILSQLFNQAVLKGNKNLVELLINKNRLNRNTLINAVQSSDLEIVDKILSLNSEPEFVNFVQKGGTALNIAVANNNIKIAKRLLSVPCIDTNLYDEKNCTPLMTAITTFNIEMIDLFVDFYGDRIQSQIYQINEAIEFLLKTFSSPDNNSTNKKTIERDDDSYDDDEDDNNDEDRRLPKKTLFDMKSSFLIKNKDKMFNVITRLCRLENVKLDCHFSSYTLLSYAVEFNEIDLFKFLLSSNKIDVNTYVPSTGNTALMIAIENKNIEMAQLLIEHEETDINHINYKGQTAFTIASQKELETVIYNLISSKKFDLKKSCIEEAYFISNEQISKQLLKIDGFDINMNMKIQDYTSLVNKQKSFNQYNYKFNDILDIPFITPLIKAIIERQDEVIDLIICHPSFDKRKSRYIDALFACVYVDKIDLFKKLLDFFNSDVNISLQNGTSLLCFTIILRNNDLMTDILNHESFDSRKSDILNSFIKAGIFNTNKITGRSSNTGIPPFVAPGFGLPNYAPNNNNNNNNNNNFGGFARGGWGGGAGAWGGGPFFQQNVALIRQMNELCEFDEAHENLINFHEKMPDGKTFFTSINSNLQNINDVFNFLIEHGCDPNEPDDSGLYPLEYAIRMNNTNFVRLLINYDNINLKIISNGINSGCVKGDTVLHMLVSSLMNDFLNDILNRNEIDINAENEDGDTCFIIACRLRKQAFIIALFEHDELDYQHRNKKGEDGLEQLERTFKQSKCSGFGSFGFNFGGGAAFQMTRIKVDDINPLEKREYYQKLMKFF